MTIGIIVSFFDFRNDVRRVISELAKRHQVIIYGKIDHRQTILKHMPNSVVFREIKERKRTLKNVSWEYLFLLLKRIPKSTNNYFLMERLKISNMPSRKSKLISRILYAIHRFAPKVLGYDCYLKNIEASGETDLKGVDQFIGFSELPDDFLVSRLIKGNYPFKVYVYSWDHPCKHTRFSRSIQYCCWNEAIKEDIVALQNISPNQIKIIGASQFSYIHIAKQLFNTTKFSNPFTFKYVYYGCAIGIKSLVKDEVSIIASIASQIKTDRPDIKLVVRPYPVLLDWGFYDGLKVFDNVLIDDNFKSGDLSTAEELIMDKFVKIEYAEAFIHTGSTIGLEACFFDTPSFIVDFGYDSRGPASIYSFIHQYQNDKYIGNTDCNILESPNDLTKYLNSVNKQEYLRRNKRVSEQFPIVSFEDFAEALITNEKISD